MKFLEKRIVALFCKGFSSFQRFRRYRHKTVSLKDLKVLDKKIKVTMAVGIHKKQMRASEKGN